MCTAYTDGTKLCIEMALLANALGLATPVPGMHGPRAAHVREVFDLLDVDGLWRRHGPFVDYVLGAQPDGGVFAIGRCEHPYQRDMMAYYKMGKGPLYLFYRPYHLCHVEAMKCVAEAALDGRSLLEPSGRLPGERLRLREARPAVGRDTGWNRRLRLLRDDRQLRGRGFAPGPSDLPGRGRPPDARRAQG